MNQNIVLIGMPGSGKSSLGKIIAEKLHIPFIDMDIYMESNEGKTIKEMFAISEDYFRDFESKYSILLGKLNSSVIATGGGVVKRKKNIENLKKNSIIVFIDRPLEDIIKDVDIEARPLLRDGAELVGKLYRERIELYKEYCHIEIRNEGPMDKVADLIIDKVGVWKSENTSN